MRKIEKSKNIPHSLQNAPVPNNKEEVREEIYKAGDVRLQLLNDQYSKCAYCESKISRKYNDVEHYRPKSLYYWLGHEWNNLLYSCPICNRSYKKDNFPLKDETARVTMPGDLTVEQPLVINPVTDEPSAHIVYHRYEMVGLTDEGKTTINLFHLNDREERAELIDDRARIFEQYSNAKECFETAQKILQSPLLSAELRGKMDEMIHSLSRAIELYASKDAPYSGMFIQQM